jgi:hypothetical protein
MDFKEIDLTEAQGKKLKKLAEQSEALQAFIQTVTKAGEDRFTALKQLGQEAYQEIALAHGLDLNRVAYAPNKDFTKLIPVSVRVLDGPQA